jgi:hypothetical protein
MLNVVQRAFFSNGINLGPLSSASVFMRHTFDPRNLLGPRLGQVMLGQPLHQGLRYADVEQSAFTVK